MLNDQSLNRRLISIPVLTSRTFFYKNLKLMHALILDPNNYTPARKKFRPLNKLITGCNPSRFKHIYTLQTFNYLFSSYIFSTTHLSIYIINDSHISQSMSPNWMPLIPLPTYFAYFKKS